ncbi:translesion DNA synthesis-associated protein ImuA [Saccharospirillum salsuginis]|uniref:CDP-6-deoxy-delta-3,4-glucoseen reductase n=1 Tax=Saccharospirillum salsuginis TaxID=418750 RepID=A0A918NHD5_9GAMM|nr:translesion DNA synthesis-associated protein ImuA [Saccharospirillum salsuginis]GGX73255.1 CDP-6-deoxy-delta-3,4-glucoseen reductase [Saccharospirillum salsuginis]
MTLLHELTRNGQVWTGHDWRRTRQQAQPSGHAALDTELPGGGWPLGAVTEILVHRPGQGELRLLLPALSELSRNDSRWQVWFNPPFQPYGPGLAQWGLALDRMLVCQTRGADDLLWSLEQCLNTGGSQAVVAWVEQLDKARMRRLQLAAEKGRIPVFLLRPARFESAPSVAALRLRLTSPGPERACVDILKRRAGWPVQDIELPLPLFGEGAGGHG